MPLPPKKTVKEHVAARSQFLEEKLPLLVDACSGHGHVFFVDAADFVQGALLCCLWCVCRLFIRGASGRQRYCVLGACNAVTNEQVRITTAGTVSSETMCDLLRRIATLGLRGPVTLVLDNARYQHLGTCQLMGNYPVAPASAGYRNSKVLLTKRLKPSGIVDQAKKQR